MKALRLACTLFFCTAAVWADEPTALSPSDEIPDGGYLALEGALGYNTFVTSQYFRAPLFFTGASAFRLISTRMLLLSDIIHASDYFAGRETAVAPTGLYTYNFALIDVDYLSWHGRLYSAGFGGGAAHQGFLISGAERSAHAALVRLRGQFYFFWSDYFASQLVATLPVALYQSATNSLRMLQTELNLLLDFTGHVRNPETQSVLLSVSLHYDYTHLNHPVRHYNQHELTPMFKAMVLY